MRRRDRYLSWTAVLIVAAIGVRVAMPSMLERYVNGKLSSLQAYQGSISGVTVALWRGAYRIDELRLSKRTGGQTPFLSSDHIEFSVEWPSLLHGAIVGEVSFERPTLNLVTAESEQRTQLGKEVQWADQLKALFPFRFNTVTVHDGTVTFHAPGIRAQDALVARHVELNISNLTNVIKDKNERTDGSMKLTPKKSRATDRSQTPNDGRAHAESRALPEARDQNTARTQNSAGNQDAAQNQNVGDQEQNQDEHQDAFADFMATADVLKSGSARVAGSVNPLAPTPTFYVNLTAEKISLPELNPWLRRYLKADAAGGTFQLYVEIAAADGRFKGYAKPLLRNVNLHGTEDEHKSALKKFWEGTLDALAKLFENPETHQVGARIPLSGTIENPRAGVLAAIVSMMHNAFIGAFASSLEGSISLRDVKENLNPYDPETQGDEKKMEDRKAQKARDQD